MSEPNVLRLAPAALLAGLAGTAAMTLGQALEQRFTGREDSRTPARGVERATGYEPNSDRGEEQLSNLTHWSYGTALGTGFLLLRGVDEPARTALFLAGAWGLALALESFANPDEPATDWSAAGLGTDLGHHIVYAVATGAAFGLAERVLSAQD